MTFAANAAVSMHYLNYLTLEQSATEPIFEGLVTLHSMFSHSQSYLNKFSSHHLIYEAFIPSLSTLIRRSSIK